MKLSQRLTTKQSQSLVMTPQLVQSIKLLQLGNAELAEFVHEEIEKNPLLVLDPDTSERRATQQESDVVLPSTTSQDETAQETSEVISKEMTLEASRNEQEIDASFENVYDKDTSGSPGGSGDAISSNSNVKNPEESNFLNRVGEVQSLTQFLEMQIACEFGDLHERKIATYIAHGLDEDGYFREPLSEVASHLNANIDVVASTLKKFHQLEPSGIGAQTLSECLEIQLKDHNRFDPAMAKLIGNLDLLAKREFRKLMKLCHVGEEDLHDMIMEIRELDPRPAGQFEEIISQVVIPDVLITQRNDGGWAIELNSEALPKALINRQYYAELNKSLEGVRAWNL